MDTGSRLVWIVGTVVLAVCLSLSAALSTAISVEAGRAQLVYTDVAAEGDPPSVGIGIAMGAFRGLFVNYLWLRANHLKEQGKFYEAIELSRAITRLQPRFPRVWAFHAWNMAYNISVATKTASERWQWVNAGINLLRSEAIPKNPNDPLLYKELAWIFVHKMQGYSDDANRYYKRRLAEEWTYVLGTPPRLPEGRDVATEAMLAWFDPIVDAPRDLETVIAREIADLRTAQFLRPDQPDPPSMVAELADRIQREAGLALDMQLLRLVALRRVFDAAWYAEKSLVQLGDSQQNAALNAMLTDARFTDAWDRLLPFVRRQVLESVYKMRPETMAEMMRRYGPLDFRHPGSHAVYWATLGVDEALQRQSTTSTDTINVDRIVVHGLQEIWRTGRIYYDLITDEYVTLTDLNFTDSYGDTIAFLADEERAGVAQKKERAFTLYGIGYENFLKDVIRTYYRLGRLEEAQMYYERFTTWGGRNTNDPGAWEDTKLPLDEFVELQFEGGDRLTVPYVYSSEVFGALTDAYIRGLIGGDRKAFESQWKYAQRIHKIYFDYQSTRTTVDAQTNRMDELPPDFNDAAAIVLRQLIASGSLRAGQASLVFQQSPLTIQQMIFDGLAAFFSAQGLPEQAFKSMFPEPPGMADFRAIRAAREAESDEARKRELNTEVK
jgi:hypothetical protein